MPNEPSTRPVLPTTTKYAASRSPGLNEVLQATNLGCPVSGVGQCGFSLAARDFQLTLGTANAALHDVTWTFNLVVPEPSTALLVAVGLCLTGLRSRIRRER